MSSPTRNRGVGFDVAPATRARFGDRPIAALVAQLACRVGHGEDAEAVLDDVGLQHPRARAAYLAAAGLPAAGFDGDAPC